MSRTVPGAELEALRQVSALIEAYVSDYGKHGRLRRFGVGCFRLAELLGQKDLKRISARDKERQAQDAKIARLRA
jgi:hypothetical protein